MSVSSTWCWPCPPSCVESPEQYTSENLSKIPTGSLYFGSRKNPLSEINARITYCPYDVVGICFQSKFREGNSTYVYLLNKTCGVSVVVLSELIKDSSIVYHSVLPIKNMPTALCRQRNRILKELFQKYQQLKVTHSLYQTVCALIGLPMSPAKQMTPYELVGKILFQAGLLWDDRFGTGDKNPVGCFEDSFFQDISQPCLDQVTVALITPQTQATIKCGKRLTLRSTSFLPEDSRMTQKGGGEVYADSSLSESLNSSFDSSFIKSEFDSSESDTDSTNSDLDSAFPRKTRSSSSEFSEPYLDYYRGEDEEQYKHCYRPSKLCRDERETYPCRKSVHTPTVSFQSLKPSDFLINYYKSYRENPNCPESLVEPYITEVVSLAYTLSRRYDAGQLNKLNMSWYGDKLVPVEVTKPSQVCRKKLEEESESVKEIILELQSKYTESMISGGRLVKICRKTSELGSELHLLSREIGAVVPASSQSDAECEFKIKVSSPDPCATKYVIVIPGYMWKGQWSYEFGKPSCWTKERQYALSCRIKLLMNRAVQLKRKLPPHPFLDNLVCALLDQAHEMYKYVTNCQDYSQEDLEKVIEQIYSEE